MTRIAFVPLVGCRVESAAVRALGVKAPDLRKRGNAVEALPALGLLTLAGQCHGDVEATWHPAKLADDDLVQSIVGARPDLAALSATTATAEEAYALAGRLRAEGICTVMGGLHATACPEEAGLHVDAVVVGEGESVWPEVVADARRGQLRPRYAAAWSPADVDWPMPRFALHGASSGRWTLQTQRGCPFACEFCAASRLLGPPREKPLDVLARELNALCEIDPAPVLELADDNTFAVRRDAHGLLDLLAASGARWFTEVDWRLGERPDVLERLAATGCVQVLVGLESPVFRHPGMGAKDAEASRRLAAIAAIQDAGVVVHGCFIVGSDGETPASIERLGDFLLACDLAEIQVSLETPFPGTALRRRLAAAGRLLPHRTWRHHTLFDVTYEPDGMTVEELESGFHALLGRVHAPEAVSRRAQRRRSIWRRL